MTKKLSRHAFPASPTDTSIGESSAVPSQRVWYLRPPVREVRKRKFIVFKGVSSYPWAMEVPIYRPLGGRGRSF